MIDFITNLSLFGIIGYIVMCVIVLTAISHHIQYWMMKRENIMFTYEEAECWKEKLKNTEIEYWNKINLLAAKQKEKPVALALSRLLAAPHRLKNPQEMERILVLEIERLISPLETVSEQLKSAAPAWGLFFTIVGVILASKEFSESASVIKMLASIGPALGTTALGAIASIIEKGLLYSCLIPLEAHMRRDGGLFLMDIADLYTQKTILKEKLKAPDVPHSLEGIKRWQ